MRAKFPVAIAPLMTALVLAGCGLEAPPVAPQPEPEQPAPGVTIGGSGYIGASVSR